MLYRMMKKMIRIVMGITGPERRVAGSFIRTAIFLADPATLCFTFRDGRG